MFELGLPAWGLSPISNAPSKEDEPATSTTRQPLSTKKSTNGKNASAQQKSGQSSKPVQPSISAPTCQAADRTCQTTAPTRQKTAPTRQTTDQTSQMSVHTRQTTSTTRLTTTLTRQTTTRVTNPIEHKTSIAVPAPGGIQCKAGTTKLVTRPDVPSSIGHSTNQISTTAKKPPAYRNAPPYQLRENTTNAPANGITEYETVRPVDHQNKTAPNKPLSSQSTTSVPAPSSYQTTVVPRDPPKHQPPQLSSRDSDLSSSIASFSDLSSDDSDQDDVS